MARKAKPKEPTVDGITPKVAEQVVRAIRQVWAWSPSRRMVQKRCTNEQGFGVCELCNKMVPKVQVDHVDPVGAILIKTEDGYKFNPDYLNRMFLKSTEMKGTCASCHSKKTKEEKKLREASYGSIKKA